MTQSWPEAQAWEASWWGDCTNTLQEEIKQGVYAQKMGIDYNLAGKRILDLGGGPVSLLLKCKRHERFNDVVSNGRSYVVVDPLEVPDWVVSRYQCAGIDFEQIPAEGFYLSSTSPLFDEVWIYNVLQHTEAPEQIIQVALSFGKIVRIFEWIEIPASEGHIQVLTESNLNEWLGGEGKVEELHESGCNGKAYYGIFKGLNHVA